MPEIVWEENRIKEIPEDQFKTILVEDQPEYSEPGILIVAKGRYS